MFTTIEGVSQKIQRIRQICRFHGTSKS